MARGAEAKLRRRNQKKEAKAQAEQMLSGTHDFGPAEDDENEEEELPMPSGTNDAPIEEDSSDEEVDLSKKSQKAAKAMKNRSQMKRAEAEAAAASKKGGIKTMPLILLILLTGTTVLPAILYAGDFIGNFAQKHHVIGKLGYKLGVGATPKKRVLSFYEKHDPEKVTEVPKILSKYYGDYPTLIKRLERKYQDYGYFLGWEQDEAPMTVALEHVLATRDEIAEKFWMHAPQPVKTAATNAKYNISKLYKRFRKVWKRTLWPMLEPIFGVPKGGAAQKRKDAQEARQRRASASRSSGSGTRRKNTEFRDDVDDEH